MSRTRARGAVRRSISAVQPLEQRLCLASVVHDVDFLAGNYTFDDPAFQSQPASNVNVRAVDIAVPDDMAPGPEIYQPWGFGTRSFGWQQPRTMTRPKPGSPSTVQATAFSSIQITAQFATVPAGTTPEAYLDQVARSLIAGGYTRTAGPVPSLEPWLIAGGPFNGEQKLLKSIVAFYDKSSTFPGGDVEQEAIAEVIPAGYAPSGAAVYYSITLTATTNLQTSDPSVIPLSEASAQLLQAPTPAAHNSDLFSTAFPSLTLTGALPETLFLYDFSGQATVKPGAIQYLDQYEQAGLPVAYGTPGGNASGPASLTMALDETAPPPPVQNVYDDTMEFGLDVPDEWIQAFEWTGARGWAQGYLGDSASVVMRNKDTWARIQENLEHGAQVVLATNLGKDVNPDSGHAILLLGNGKDPAIKDAVKTLYPSEPTGDYFIVADPGGHYFADSTHGGLDVGHYGTVQGLRARSKGITYGGRFAVYPKAALQQMVSPIRTLTINPAQPTVQVHAHSPVSVVITDPLGRKTGIGPDGSVLEEIPESEYQVAVAEEEGTGVTTLDPEEEKGVVMSNPVPGVYQVDLVGTGSGPYTLDLSTALPGQPRSVTTYAGMATPGATAHYTFTVAGAPGPRLQQVFADSTAWSPSFRQFMQAGGAGDGALGYRVNAGDTLPWVNVDRLVLRFDRELPASPLPAKVIIDGTRVAYAANPSVLDARTILLTLDQPLGATGGDRLRIADDGLGGSPDIRFNTLPGDTTRDGKVLADDYSAVKKKFFKDTTDSTTGDTSYSPFHDVNGDGVILAFDFSEVKKRFFNTLPASQPPAAAVAVATSRRPRRPRDAYVELLPDL